MRRAAPLPAAKFVLASGSPRRADLLADARFAFEIARPHGPESTSSALSIRELTTLNATRKALEISACKPDAVVLAADTLVALDGLVIGKPGDLSEARQILRRLSGRTHQVCTSVTIVSAPSRKRMSFSVISHVTFRSLDNDAINSYIAKINPLDKAGAYAAQREGAAVIAGIHGSYTNVVGLPMDETIRALREFGITPNDDHSLGQRQQISSLFPSGSSKNSA